MLSHISLSLNIAAASLTNFRCKLHNDIVKNDDATQTVISVNCWRSGPNYLRKLVQLTLHWNARRHIAAAVSRERRTENSARESTDAVERGPKSLTCSSKTINLQLGFTWMAKLLPSCARPPGGPRALYIICMTHVHAWAFEKSDGGADCEFSNLVCTQRWLILRLPGNRHFFTHLARTPTPTLPGAVCAANACRSRRGLKKNCGWRLTWPSCSLDGES